MYESIGMKKHIPNFITCLNLLSGCIAIVFAFKGALQTSALFILLSALFDFMDGMMARLLKAYSPLGKELDSLADVISFGLVPGVIVYQILLQSGLNESLAFTAFIIPVFSALRLAKFNIDERQSDRFIGLPTPANALFFGSIPFILEGETYISRLLANPVILIILTVIMSILLIAELPLFSLKIKRLSWSEYRIQFIFLILSAICILIFKFVAVPAIILLYLILSLISVKKKNV